MLTILSSILAILLVVLILLQRRGTGLGAGFGGEGNVYRSKRGIEKFLSRATVVVSILFFAISLWNLF